MTGLAVAALNQVIAATTLMASLLSLATDRPRQAVQLSGDQWNCSPDQQPVLWHSQAAALIA
jgi:hypothetical protein